MKKAIAILLVATLFLFLAGCGRNENIDDQNDEVSEEMPGDEETKDEGKMDAEIQSDPEASQADDSGTTSDASENDDSGIVAKSSNAVSSEEKEAVLEELDKELGDLLNSIDKLETVDDSDLVIE
ncbi:MAG: hypothetical protein C0604_02940 [Clostridiales bacterium]|nr:MAG: hypothetical protein C0604_02940 [Clostridiales bacterium]